MDFNKILDSPSRLNSFKREHGLKVTNCANVSGYILCSKVKKAVSEMTNENYQEIRRKYLIKNTQTHRDILVSRFSIKADRLEPDILSYMLYIRDEEGSDAFFELFRVSTAKLRRRAQKLKKSQE